ncbi:MAG TPA: ATP-binding cassette domain-containing protein [Gaiella sp.]|nr:ATP-binding cassette domain-containing protein [Gaiella sp.]
MTQEPVLEVEGLVKHFHVASQLLGGDGTVHAVDGVSLRIGSGELLGLVGESGSGKSTVGNCVARLVESTAGTIRIRGTDATHLSRREMRPLRRNVHMVFQDPHSSLKPRMTCGQMVGEPLRLHRLAPRRDRDRRIVELFDQVGLRPELRHRYPHELSGGQRQRVGLARALSASPSLLIADEPVSALDVSVQASILNLLRELQRELGFSCLFITHDLATVEFLCDRVAVMYLGRNVEQAPTDELFAAPRHPYTQALLSAAVVPDRRGAALPHADRARGRRSQPARAAVRMPVPDPLPLAARSAPQSVEEEPELRHAGRDHLVACHLVGPGGVAPEVLDLTAGGV